MKHNKNSNMIKFYLFWNEIAVMDEKYILVEILRFLDKILLISTYKFSLDKKVYM